ncbi:MAG TPA: hypothetical protein VF192_12070 [Longimicrobiales bacterium]
MAATAAGARRPHGVGRWADCWGAERWIGFSSSGYGAALGAAEIQVWTDVNGFLTADPRLAPAARPIARERGIPMVRIPSARMLGAYGSLRAIFEVFDRHRTAGDSVAASGVSVSLPRLRPDRWQIQRASHIFPV